MALTQEQVRSELRYDPDSGTFRWQKARKKRVVGGIAGTVRKSDGRRTIAIDGIRYLASRLAVLYMKGYLPEEDVDHRNLDPADDSWGNLREANSSQQKHNQRTRADNKLGIRGVQAHQGGYRARITVKGVKHDLGVHPTPELAAKAYATAAFIHYGDFARS